VPDAAAGTGEQQRPARMVGLFTAHALKTQDLERLVNAFNPAAATGVMCHYTLSIGWDGTLYDCDFNQMLELPLGAGRGGGPRTVWDLSSLDRLAGSPIATGRHCFGCTAGAGSSCGGALQ